MEGLFGKVAEWLRTGLQNRFTRVRIPSLPPMDCLGGGIGRHAGLKILFLHRSAGSIPAPGTIRPFTKIPTPNKMKGRLKNCPVVRFQSEG